MRVCIVFASESNWQVWVTLEDHNPIRDAFGFCIGTGKTRDAAVADAVKDLEGATEVLQSPPDAVEVLDSHGEKM